MLLGRLRHSSSQPGNAEQNTLEMFHMQRSAGALPVVLVTVLASVGEMWYVVIVLCL
jgi:hypothetical protein